MKNSNRILRLAVGVIVLLFAGIIYAWSILKAPLAAEFGWTSAQLALNFTLTMCFFCIGGVFSGLLSKKLSPFIRMTAGALLVAAGFVLCAFLDEGSLWLLYLAYGFMAGSGIGIVYNSVIAATSAWFPDKKGLCSGSLMMGFGFSTLVLGNLAGKLVALPSFGWRKTYILLGVVIGAVLFIAAFLIKSPENSSAKAKAKSEEVKSYTTAEMLRRPSFYLVFLFFITLAAVGSTAISFAKDYSLAIGMSEGFSVTVVGLLSICNGLGRLASGALFDSAGLRRTQIITSVVVVAATALAFVGVIAKLPIIGIIGIILCGFSYGFSPTVSAAIAGAFYGPRNYALNFSVLNLVLIPASFTATLAGSFITATGSYVSTFIMLIGLSLLGAILNLFIKKA